MNTSPSHLANTYTASNIDSSDSEIDADDASARLLHSHYDSSSEDILTSGDSSPATSPTFPSRFPGTFLKEIPESKDKPTFTFVHCILVLKLYLIMTLILFAVILLLVFAVKDTSSEVANFENSTSTNESGPFRLATFQINLDRANQFRVFWSVDEVDESVLFELRIVQKGGTELGWFAFGFSDYGEVADADGCLLWFDKRGKMWFDDIKTDNESFVLADQQSNDCHILKAKRHGAVLRVAFRRRWDTCDPEDYVIDTGTTHLIYATGPGPISRIEGLRLQNYPHGYQRTQLLKPPSASHLPKLPYYTKKFEALQANTTVPPIETTYWCRLIQLPTDFHQKSHIIQYEAVIANGSQALVHHMELFHCEVGGNETLPEWNGACSDPNQPEVLKACKKVIAAWAYGAGPMIYPRHVGLPVGGENYSLYVMLEVHYNNPELVADVVDSSGVRLYYTDHLRQTDAAILEIGLEYTDKNSIPPGTVMELRGYCVSECTRASLPPYGITIFASQLHTHMTGVRTWTKHIRGGIELANINRDNHYSPHFQEIRQLPRPVTIFPGDSLINVCRYDTRARSRMTLGGFGIRDEMCVNYLHYYPKTNLEVCKSSIDTDFLRQYFERMRLEEGQNTSAAFPVSTNYYNIHWNAKRIAELDRYYQMAPLSMQCNQSDGSRFPGYWNGMPTTRVTVPLKSVQRKNCRWMMKSSRQGDGVVELAQAEGVGSSLVDDEDIDEIGAAAASKRAWMQEGEEDEADREAKIRMLEMVSEV